MDVYLRTYQSFLLESIVSEASYLRMRFSLIGLLRLDEDTCSKLPVHVQTLH